MESHELDELTDRIKKRYPEAHKLIVKIHQASGEHIGEIVCELISGDGKPMEKEQIRAKLKERYPCLFLSEAEVDRLHKMITGNSDFQDFIRFKGVFSSEEEKEVIKNLAGKIHASLPDEDKNNFQPSDIANTLGYIPVMNLGVIEIPGRGQPQNLPDYLKQNLSFFKTHGEIASRVLLDYFLKKGEGSLCNGDTADFLQDSEKELNELGLFDRTAGSSPTLSLGDIVVKELNKRTDYAGSINKRSKLELFLHQTNRIYEAVENGTQRMLCADATGAGKTLIAVTTKLLSDEKMGKKGRVIVFAPGQTMDSVWSQDRIDFYTSNLSLDEKYKNQKVAIIEKYHDFDRIKDDTNFIIINYDKLSLDKKPANNRYWQRITELCKSADMTVFDEGHRLRNYKTNTSKAFIGIVEETKNKPAMILTATPCPNKLGNLGFLMYILNPNDERFAKYKSQPYIYPLDPSAIRDLMIKGQWFIFPKTALEKIFDLPALHQPKDIDGATYVDMNKEEAQSYFKIWRPSAFAGEKIYDLRKILMKSKIRQLDNIVRGFANENQQTIVYTPLKEGIIGPIKEHLEKIYGKGKVCVITGDIKRFKEKVRLSKEFQKRDYRALICTDVMNEGIALTCGNKIIHAVVMEPAIVPAVYTQLVGRMHRYGQKEEVHVHVLISKSEPLEKMMGEEIAALEKEYDVKFRSNWKPTTIDVDRYNIAEIKRRIFEEVIRRALPLPKELLEIMELEDNSGYNKTAKAYTSTVNIKEFKKRKQEDEKGYFGKNVNRSAWLKGKKYDESKLAPYLIPDYRNKKAWVVSTAAESNRVAASLINQLEQTGKTEYRRIADLGSGPACLARIIKDSGLEKEVDCVDGMAEIIELGKEFCDEEQVRNVAFHKRKMWDTGLESKRYDVVTCCNALHYNDQDSSLESDRDIERIIIESNRILKKDGYFIITLIPTKKKSEVNNLSALLSRYEFDVKYSNDVQVVGYEHKAGKRKKQTSQMPVIVAKKTEDYNSKELVGRALTVYSHIRYKAVGGSRRIFPVKREKELRKSELFGKQYLTYKGKPLFSEVPKWA